MAYPTRATIQSALEDIKAACFEDTSKSGADVAWKSLHRVVQGLRPLTAEYAGLALLDIGAFTPAQEYTTTLTVTDLTDANLAAFFALAGELGTALERDAKIGDTFKVNGTGDTTDNALQTAKGSPPAANDVFVVSSTTTIHYLGAGA